MTTNKIVEEFEKQFSAYQTDSDQPYPLLVDWLTQTINKVREVERQRILSMSERLYGDDGRGHFEDVMAVKVSKI